MQQRAFIYYGVALLGTMLLAVGCNNGTRNSDYNAPSDGSLTISSPSDSTSACE